MKSLSLESFVSSEADIEINQYRILSGLKEFRAEFNKNKLYPSLSELVFLSSQLEEVLNKKSNLNVALPKGIKGGMPSKNVFIEIADDVVEKKDYQYNLIEWALPIFKDIIHEAYILYDFVDESINIKEIGLSPIYKDEGFMFVSDNENSKLNIYRYECADYSTNSKPFFSLKAKYLESARPINFSGSAEFLKMELCKRYQERSNIAAYLCETDLDFPFNETIFPIAKRKLLGYLSDLL